MKEIEEKKEGRREEYKKEIFESEQNDNKEMCEVTEKTDKFKDLLYCNIRGVRIRRKTIYHGTLIRHDGEQKGEQI